MIRKEKQVTDMNLIYDKINKAKVCRLALVDGSRPYIIPLSFGFDGTYIYIHSAKKGKKIDLLKSNNQVCIEFEDNVEIKENELPCNWGFGYFTVICNGTATLISDLDEKIYALNEIIKHYSPDKTPYHFTEQKLSSVFVYKITLDELTGKRS